MWILITTNSILHLSERQKAQTNRHRFWGFDREITIPRHSRGFFTLGSCPSLLATRGTSLNNLSLAFTSAYSLSTGSYQMAVALLIGPLVIDFLYIPLSLLCSSLPYLHSTLGTKTPDSYTYTAYSSIARILKNNPPEIPTGCLYGLFFFFLPVAFHFFHKGIVTLGLRGFGHLPGRPVWGIICPLFQRLIRGVRFLTVLFLGVRPLFLPLDPFGPHWQGFVRRKNLARRQTHSGYPRVRPNLLRYCRPHNCLSRTNTSFW